MVRFAGLWRWLVVGIVLFSLVILARGVRSRLERRDGGEGPGGHQGVFSDEVSMGERPRHFRDPFRKVRGLALLSTRDLAVNSSRPLPNRSYWLVESLDRETECLLDFVRVASVRGDTVALGEMRRSRSRLRDYARSRDLELRLRLAHEAAAVAGVEPCSEWQSFM
jgi:hypothetical protein